MQTFIVQNNNELLHNKCRIGGHSSGRRFRSEVFFMGAVLSRWRDFLASALK